MAVLNDVVRSEVEVGDPQAVRAAWRDLGQQLAAMRKAAKLNQHHLADRTDYSRSSIANIEIGLQHVNRSFWETVDALLGAAGELLRGYDAAEVLQRKHQRTSAVGRAGYFDGGSAAKPSVDMDLIQKTSTHSTAATLQPDMVVVEEDGWSSFSRVTAMLAQQRQAVSPGALLSLVETHRDCLAVLYRKAKRDPLRADIGAMLGEASIVASRLWSAQGNRALALAHCAYARRIADKVGSIRVGATARLFESNLHSEASTLIEADGDIMIGLRLLDEAAAAKEYLTPAALARISAEQAQAFAALGLKNETKSALERAEMAVNEMTKEHCIGLYSDWSPARLLVYKGTCQTLLGEFAKAADTLQAALNVLAFDSKNTNVLLAAKVDLASAYAGVGDFEASCTMLAETYPQLQSVGNLRGLNRARRAREHLSPWNSEPALQDLDELMARGLGCR